MQIQMATNKLCGMLAHAYNVSTPEAKAEGLHLKLAWVEG